MDHYTPLATRPVPRSVRLCAPDASATQETLDSPAIRVMTDLRQVTAVVVDPQATMEAAHDMMLRRGVRMLLALDADGTLSGLITATDVLGEKPLHLVHDRRIHHSDILVADVMTPASRLDAFDWETVRAARVGNVVTRLQQTRRQHALVSQSVDGPGGWLSLAGGPAPWLKVRGCSDGPP
jgi:CBS-domain-containing membrane protein